MTTEISAKHILSSVGQDAPVIRTLQLRYPRFIHAELMTHRAFSRNARSSRAVPVERMLQEIITDPVIPRYWGANQKGMQASEECDASVELLAINNDVLVDYSREQAWLWARDYAVMAAQGFSRAGYHKQVVNRLLEPFMHIDTLVTSTNYSNWDYLRDSKHAEPHIRDLAQVMKECIRDAPEPTLLRDNQWHAPFIEMADLVVAQDRSSARIGLREEGETVHAWRERCAADQPTTMLELIKLSVPRCAAISYKPFEGSTKTFEEAIAKHEELAANGHWSPFEHQARPDRAGDYPNDWEQPDLHGNLTGWIQYRKTFAGEYR